MVRPVARKSKAVAARAKVVYFPFRRIELLRSEHVYAGQRFLTYIPVHNAKKQEPTM